MMQFLRNSSDSWAVRIFLGLLVVAFAILWSAGDVSQFWRGGKDPVIVTAGSKTVTRSEFIHRMQKVATQLPPGTDIEPYKAMIKQQVLEQLYTEMLFDLEVERLGIVLGDNQVSRAIQNFPAFQDQDGDFDKLRYEAYLRGSQTSEKEFVETLRHQLQREQLFKMMTSGMTTPKALIQPLLDWVEEKRSIETLDIVSEEIAVAVPTQAQIETFYQDNPKQFTAPEHRSVSLIPVTLEIVLAQTELTAEELAQGFEKYRQDIAGPLPTEAEKQKIEKLLKQEKAQNRFSELVTQIEDDIAGGASLDEISKSHGLPLVKLTHVQQDQTFQPEPGSAPLNQSLIQDVVAQTFELGIEEEANWVETDAGAFLAIKVAHIEPAAIKPLAEVKNEVVKQWSKEQKMAQAKQQAQSIVESPQAKQGLATFVQSQAFHHKPRVTLSRDPKDDGQEFPMALRNKIFTAKLAEPVMDRTTTGYRIAVVKSIDRKTAQPDAQKLETFSRNLKRQLQDDILNQLLFALQNQYGFEENSKALEAI